MILAVAHPVLLHQVSVVRHNRTDPNLVVDVLDIVRHPFIERLSLLARRVRILRQLIRQLADAVGRHRFSFRSGVISRR